MCAIGAAHPQTRARAGPARAPQRAGGDWGGAVLGLQLWRVSTAGRQMRTRALDIQLLMRLRDRPVMRTSAAFSSSDGSARRRRRRRRRRRWRRRRQTRAGKRGRRHNRLEGKEGAERMARCYDVGGRAATYMGGRSASRASPRGWKAPRGSGGPSSSCAGGAIGQIVREEGGRAKQSLLAWRLGCWTPCRPRAW